MTDQSSTLFADLRISTCRMLGLDPDNVTALQNLHCDLIGSLRLEVDRIQAGQLRGEPADLRALTTASEALENLLKPAFAIDADAERNNQSARDILADLIERVRIADEHEAREQECDLMLREEMAAVAAALPVSAPEPSLSATDKLSTPHIAPAFIDHDTVTIIDGTCTEVAAVKPTKQSQTYEAFARHIEQQGNSLKQGDQWSPPSGW